MADNAQQDPQPEQQPSQTRPITISVANVHGVSVAAVDAEDPDLAPNNAEFTYDPSTKVMATQHAGHVGPWQVRWVSTDLQNFLVTFPNSPFQRNSFRRNQVAVLRSGTTPGIYKYNASVVDRHGNIFADHCPEIDVEC